MRISILASRAPLAQSALHELNQFYPSLPVEEADVIVALGGDGFMLETLHANLGRDVKVYGMNCGSVGFLMNDYHPDNLLGKIQDSEEVDLYPLCLEATDVSGQNFSAHAINEVSIFRQHNQAAKFELKVDGKVRIAELIGDGCIVSTPAGSTAYNLSAHGPIVPLESNLLALTAINAFRPRHWRSALLKSTSEVEFTIHESEKRPVSVTADSREFRDIINVKVREDRTKKLTLLHNRGEGYHERILAEQFGGS